MKSDVVADAANAFISTFNYKPVTPHAQTLEELYKSPAYIMSFPHQFSFSNSGPREYDLMDVYEQFIQFVKSKEETSNLKELIWPVFCAIIIKYRKYGEEENIVKFSNKYLESTIPSINQEETKQMISDESAFEKLAGEFATKRFTFWCNQKTMDLLNDYINKPHNAPIRQIITSTIIPCSKDTKPPDGSIRFIPLQSLIPPSVVVGDIPNSSIASIPRSAPYVYAAMENRSVLKIDTESHETTRLYMHSSTITTLSSSSTGSLVVSGDVEGQVRLWSTHAQAKLRESMFPVWCSAFAPVGGCFVLGYQDSLARLFDATTQRPVRAFVGHSGAVTGARFHPNCALIATSAEDSSIRLWDVRSAEMVRLFVAEKANRGAPAFSYDGRLLAFGGDGVACFDIASGSQRFAGGVRARFVEFGSDSRSVLAVADDGAVVRIADGAVTEVARVEAPVVHVSGSITDELRIITSRRLE